MSRFGEARRANQGIEGPLFYAEDLALARAEAWRDAQFPKIIRAPEMVWEDTPHGRVKWIAHPEMNPRVKDIEAYIQEIPPGGRTGRHRHMAEEFMFILDGSGYSLHWDVDVEMGDTYGWKVNPQAQRFEWVASNWVYVPVNTVHQHYNASTTEPARFISATSSLFKWLGWHDLEQLDEAPSEDR